MRHLQELAPALLLALAVPAAIARADEGPGEIRGLSLGMQAATMSTDGFDDFACGSNGGPPRAPLSGWADFRTCRPEPSGLREVYVRFDEQQAYQAKALADDEHNRRNTIAQYAQPLGDIIVAGNPVTGSRGPA